MILRMLGYDCHARLWHHHARKRHHRRVGRLTINATIRETLSDLRGTMIMHKLLLATGGLLLTLLVLDSASEVLAQREGGAFWGHSHMAAHTAPQQHLLAAPRDISRGTQGAISRRGRPQNPALRGPGTPGLELSRRQSSRSVWASHPTVCRIKITHHGDRAAYFMPPPPPPAHAVARTCILHCFMTSCPLPSSPLHEFQA
jgi:hypothetical protein